MKKYTKSEIHHMLCKLQFIKEFEHTCELAGGASWNSMKNLKFEDVVNRLAHNGFSIQYEKRPEIPEGIDMVVNELIKHELSKYLV